MPRPKGSKNKVKKHVTPLEQLLNDKSAALAAVETLTAELENALAAVKAKKSELKAAQKKLRGLEKLESVAAAQAQEQQRKAEIEQLASVLVESGKSLDELRELLK